MRLLQITNQFLYKKHVCSLHDTWDSIQPYENWERKALVKEAIDGAVKACTFTIVRPMEVEHAISKSRLPFK